MTVVQMCLIGLALFAMGTGQYLLAAVAVFATALLWTYGEEK